MFCGKFVVKSNTLNEYSIKNVLRFWYKEKTLLKVTESIEYYQWYFKDKVSSVINYIVVHEMCHMKDKDHSKEFLDSVYSVMHDYEIIRQ